MLVQALRARDIRTEGKSKRELAQDLYSWLDDFWSDSDSD